MSTRSILLASIVSLASLQAGCVLVDATKTTLADTAKLLKPRPFDYRDSTDEVDPEWDMQRVGRGDKPIDRDPDPVARLMTSPKARAIEHSLGVDY